MSEIFNDRGGRPPKRGRVFQNSSHVRLVKQELNSLISIENQSFISSFRKYKIDDQNFDENFVTQFSVGSMNIICHHCDARHFHGEMSNGHFNNCCQNGLIGLMAAKKKKSAQKMMKKKKKKKKKRKKEERKREELKEKLERKQGRNRKRRSNN